MFPHTQTHTLRETQIGFKKSRGVMEAKIPLGESYTDLTFSVSLSHTYLLSLIVFLFLSLALCPTHSLIDIVFFIFYGE